MNRNYRNYLEKPLNEEWTDVDSVSVEKVGKEIEGVRMTANNDDKFSREWNFS